jgi:hypothetical protein
MKQYHHTPLQVSVQEQPWEHPSNTAELYRGLYTLSLNQMVSIVFAPTFRPAGKEAALPANFDSITTVEEAHLVSLAIADYGVAMKTADEHVEIMSWPGWLTQPPVFFTAPLNFKQFEDDLLRISVECSGTHSSLPIGSLQKFDVINFIIEEIFPSPYFSPNDRKQLNI